MKDGKKTKAEKKIRQCKSCQGAVMLEDMIHGLCPICFRRSGLCFYCAEPAKACEWIPTPSGIGYMMMPCHKSCLKDPIKLSKEPIESSKRALRTAPIQVSEVTITDLNTVPGDLISLKHLANHLGQEPKKLRKILREYGPPKSDDGWVWKKDSADLQAIIKMFNADTRNYAFIEKPSA